MAWHGMAHETAPPLMISTGAQKCGTTSLYEYLCQHPLVLRAKRRETHYLDWRWRDGVKDLAEHRATCE